MEITIRPEDRFAQLISLLKKSTNELIRMRTSMFCYQIATNWSLISEFSDVFLLSKALQ